MSRSSTYQCLSDRSKKKSFKMEFHLIMVLFLAATSSAEGFVPGSGLTKPPHIVVILADDLGTVFTL